MAKGEFMATTFLRFGFKAGRDRRVFGLQCGGLVDRTLDRCDLFLLRDEFFFVAAAFFDFGAGKIAAAGDYYY